MVGNIQNDGKVQVHAVLEDHHDTSGLKFGKFCYYYMCKDIVIDHYYCFASDLLSVSLVAQELTAVSEKWQDIGEELGVEQSSLEDIRTEYSDPGDCLREMLSEQFESCATTWKHIVAVLRTPRIGESHLADRLEVKYCSSELT